MAFSRFIFTACMLFALPSLALALNVERLEENDRKMLDSILEKTQPVIEKKQAGGNVNRLAFEELEAPLSRKEKQWIKRILKLKPRDLKVKTPRQNEKARPELLTDLRGQKIKLNGKPSVLQTAAISKPVLEAYETMMQAMEKDIGIRLYIESGHRSRAYHLRNFLKYLREHDYSLVETAELNALPGYSEHNLTVYHAVDLINEDGINGEPDVADYEALPEYQWMLKHAEDYGFTLSYPRGNPHGIGFEPWHWRLTKPKKLKSNP